MTECRPPPTSCLVPDMSMKPQQDPAPDQPDEAWHGLGEAVTRTGKEGEG